MIYDLFVSYSSADGDWVREWLLPRLERRGLRVCIDWRDFEAGVPILDNIERAIEQSAKMLAVMTPSWLESGWANFEALLMQTGDPAAMYQRLIPIKLKPCDPPRRIALLTYVDCTAPDQWATQIQRLIRHFKRSILQENPFPQHVGGLPPDAVTYIERPCDAELMQCLDNYPLIALHGDFGVGKSSLLFQMQKLADNDWCVYSQDLTVMRTENERFFIGEFFKMLGKHYGPIDTWNDLVHCLQQQRAVFLLDEFGTLSCSVARAFVPRLCFLAHTVGSQIRVIVTLPTPIDMFLISRRIENPRHIHPWHSLVIPPFNEQEVEEILQCLPEPAYSIAHRHRALIMHHSAGKPGRVQALCSSLFDQVRKSHSEEDLVQIIRHWDWKKRS